MRLRRMVGAALLIAAGAAVPAAAQTLDAEPVDVAGNRPQPAYDPIGITLGSIMIRPTLTVAPDFSSNVFAEADDPRSDLSITATPAISASMVEPRANLRLYGEAKFRRYKRYSSQDDEQFRVEASGSTELASDFSLGASLSWSDSTAGRGTVENDLSVGAPLKVNAFRTRVTLRKNFNRLYAVTTFSAAKSTYDDVELGNGLILDQGFRNSRRTGGTLNLGYEISPLLSLETRAAYDSYRYNDPRPLSNRDADGYSVSAGLRYEITQLLIAEFSAGLRKHKFNNPLFADIKGVALSGRLRWYPTPLIGVRADLSQSTTTSTLDQVSAVTVTDFRLGADYEFRRNLLLTLETGATLEDYGEIGAKTKRISLTGRMEWKANRWFRLGAFASFNTRFGSDSSLIRDYSSMQTGVRMTFAL